MFIGLAVLGAGGAALGDEPTTVAANAETTVTADAARDALNCKNATAEHARSLADQAWRDGSYQRAAECYLAAGEPTLADRAFAKAAAQNSAETARKMTATADLASAQARQLKQAFLRR
jgi:hypothetical protein